MKKLPVLFVIAIFIGIVSCKENDDYWTQYEQWRDTNDAWFIEQLGAKDDQGKPVYTKVVPNWDKSIYVLMKYYNDTSLNRDAQSPYQTSTVDVIYKGMLYDGTPFDSSYLKTDSIYRCQVKQRVDRSSRTNEGGGQLPGDHSPNVGIRRSICIVAHSPLHHIGIRHEAGRYSRVGKAGKRIETTCQPKT